MCDQKSKCHFCNYIGRKDNLQRHYKAIHKNHVMDQNTRHQSQGHDHKSVQKQQSCPTDIPREDVNRDFTFLNEDYGYLNTNNTTLKNENVELNRNIKKNDVNIAQTKPQLPNYQYQQLHLQQQDLDQANQLVNKIQMDKAKDLEEDANVNESQFQEFLKFCTHVNPSKQETRNHCRLNHIRIMIEQAKKKRQWMSNFINIRRGDKEEGRQDNSIGDGYELYV